MRSTAATPAIEPSLLDKLVDDAPGQGERYRGASLTAMRQSVRRDLENLLNAKVRWHPWPASFTELETSLVNYGLPDFSALPVGALEGRQLLCRQVAEAIRRFEPRFQAVEVEVVDKDLPLDRVLRLRIHALLRADPVPEALVFDSEVEPVHLGLKVMEGRG